MLHSGDDYDEQLEELLDTSSYIDIFIYFDIPFPNFYYFSNNFGASLVNSKCFKILHTDLANEDYSNVDQVSEVTRLVSTLSSSVRSAGTNKSDSDQLLAGSIFLPLHNTIICTSHAQSTFILKIEDLLFASGSHSASGSSKSLDIAKDPRGTSVGPQPFLPYIQKLLAESKKVPKMSLGSSSGL